MQISDQIAQIQSAVKQYGYTAEVASPDLVHVRNGKQILCATVTTIGAPAVAGVGVERIYDGRKALCGAIVRDAIMAALTGVR